MRVAALQPSITITLERLGCLELLVACTKYCADAVPSLKEMGTLIIHDAWSASAEEILAARPDLVLASVPYRMEALAAILQAGCPVMTFSPRCLADIYLDTLLLGRLVDRGRAAEILVAEMQTEIDAVRAQGTLKITEGPLKSKLGPLVYCEEWGKPLIHSQEWVKELVEAAGGRWLGTAGARVDADTVAAADPDVMIFSWCGAGDRVPLERVIEQRGWQKLRAARTSRVYCIPDEWLNTPAPTLVWGLHAIAAALQVDRFGDIDSRHASAPFVAASKLERWGSYRTARRLGSKSAWWPSR